MRAAALALLLLVLSGCATPSTVRRLRSDNATLTQRVANLESELAVLRRQVGEAARQVSALREEVGSLQREAEALRRAGPPEVLEIRFFAADGRELLPRDGWIELAEQVTVQVHLSGPATQVDLVATPTGTETYTLQQVVDSTDAAGADVLLRWRVPRGTLAHAWVVAWSGQVGRRSASVSVIRE